MLDDFPPPQYLQGIYSLTFKNKGYSQVQTQRQAFNLLTLFLLGNIVTRFTVQKVQRVYSDQVCVNKMHFYALP